MSWLEDARRIIELENQREANNEVRRICESDTPFGVSISKEEYLKRYIEESIRYCPFFGKSE